MTTAQRIEQMTLDEYVRLYEQEGAFEIIDGERKPLMPPVAIHGLIVQALFLIIYNFCQKNHLGKVIQEMPYVLSYNSNWVKGSRVPDVMFFAKERWETYIEEIENWPRKPFVIIPDFVIEVVSQNDPYTEVQQKVEIYQGDKVRLIWVVDPMRQKVAVYEGERYLTLGVEETLSGSEVIPGLQISLKDLFATVPDKDA